LELNDKWSRTVKAASDVECLVLLKRDYETMVSHEDPNTFGVSVCTVDGQIFNFGDALEKDKLVTM